MAGFDAQIMVAEEVTWGVAVAPTRGIPYVSGGITEAPNQIKSKGMLAGRRVLPSNLHALGEVGVSGTFGVELLDRTIGVLFKHALGTVATTGPVSTYYTHTFTPGSLTGKGLTIQEGIPDLTTTRPFTTAGSKITGWEVACQVGEIATMSIDVLGRSVAKYRTVADGATTNANPTVTSATAAFNADDVGKPISGTGIPAATYIGIVNSATSVGLSSSNSTNTPVNATATGSSITFTLGVILAAASYTSGMTPMSYRSGFVKSGGSSICVRGFKLGGKNLLNEARQCIGNPFHDEPLENGSYREYGGSVDMEFQDMTQYNRFISGVEFALEFNLSVPGTTASFDGLVNAYYTGSKPMISPGNFPYVVSMPFECAGTTDAAAMTCTFVTTDATP